MEGISVKVLINRTYIKTSLLNSETANFAVAFNTAQTKSNLHVQGINTIFYCTAYTKYICQ